MVGCFLTGWYCFPLLILSSSDIHFIHIFLFSYYFHFVLPWGSIYLDGARETRSFVLWRGRRGGSYIIRPCDDIFILGVSLYYIACIISAFLKLVRCLKASLDNYPWVTYISCQVFAVCSVQQRWLRYEQMRTRLGKASTAVTVNISLM